MVRSSASTARRSKRFVNPCTCRADSSGFMMSGHSRLQPLRTMDPRYCGAVNQGLQIPPKCRQCAQIAETGRTDARSSSVIMKYLLPHVTKNRRFTGRQIGEAGRLTEVSDGSGSLQVGQRLVDRDEKGRVAGEPNIAAIGADRIKVPGAR